MITAFYTAARIVLMVSGWLVALALGLAADYMLTGAKWPIFIAPRLVVDPDLHHLSCATRLSTRVRSRRVLWRRALD